MHDPEQALVYAKKLREYAEGSKDDLMIVLRVYFEKSVEDFRSMARLIRLLDPGRRSVGRA